MVPLILPAVQKEHLLFNQQQNKRLLSKLQTLYFLVKKHQDLNFETKIIGIRLKLTEIYYFKAENMKFYESDFEPLLRALLSIGLFSLIVCPHIAPKFLHFEKR